MLKQRSYGRPSIEPTPRGNPITDELANKLAPLRESPRRSALVCDVDGTLAPIVAIPEEASVPVATQRLLAALEQRYRLVACLSGRRATDARRVVGVASLTYVGNHGLEFLLPGEERAQVLPGASAHGAALRSFAKGAHTPDLQRAGIRLEDKESIWSFHWRQAADEESAVRVLQRVAEAAEAQGFFPHWGRKVLEIRPAVAVDKGTAIRELLGRTSIEAALYGGDDTTDLDGFRGLRHLQSSGSLAHSLCVGVSSEEGPGELTVEADLVVEGPDGFRDLLARL